MEILYQAANKKVILFANNGGSDELWNKTYIWPLLHLPACREWQIFDEQDKIYFSDIHYLKKDINIYVRGFHCLPQYLGTSD